ncbi:hypothetical protein GLOTRDRAFT_99060 [Gloeophyllum trabeum ATCC 11539]|uniref:Uncharacterized protein n=1 Tax=Gloeophyllum trabeum (strain ATCC 11539 / FP-39264 / Madison 617) TaxID=670483 RepID=S7RYT5_GLOTA|nr:uncharacterized protein GLOTRDRAFT_99060 [Gloeophyllum trabeum ATCC 11539]EPQ58569.1 hypothetical protein GLOTRDRAFT_99060 [Gloeophyllum trabeum ATCC 11539]
MRVARVGRRFEFQRAGVQDGHDLRMRSGLASVELTLASRLHCELGRLTWTENAMGELSSEPAAGGKGRDLDMSAYSRDCDLSL